MGSYPEDNLDRPPTSHRYTVKQARKEAIVRDGCNNEAHNGQKFIPSFADM